MREILFRGKRTDNSEWVEGLLWKKKYNTQKLFISCFPDKDDNEEVFVIYPETIGQYTGLLDKNGKKIFENGYFVIDEQTYKVVFDNAQYILTNIFSCDIILLKDNSNKGVFIDEI